MENNEKHDILLTITRHGGFCMDTKRWVYIGTIVFFLLYAVSGLYLQNITGLFIHRAIIWNLLLALSPMFFSELFLYIKRCKKGGNWRISACLCLIAWLLLFPNVPYLITDFIHISPLTFYVFTEEGTWYVREIMPWIQLFHIATGVIAGLYIGYSSLYHLHRYMSDRYYKVRAWLLIAFVCIASGYGVYLGRFLRLNSWDILHPFDLLLKIVKNTEFFAIEFTLIFAMFVFVSYLMYYFICKRGKRDEDIIRK